MSAFPSFASFHESVHGYAPFPWQSRLAAEVLAHGWPEILDVPTGAGKTSTLDIALYCLAAAPERMPRRAVLVVDRRVVVDQGATHARKLRAALASAQAGPAHVVAAALRQLGRSDTVPFDVAVMRGGMPRDNDWAKWPDRPMLGVSTVDQLGSRLLFRGYGVSPLSASIHAGLLGHDTLILLDEVHLAVPLAETLDQIRQRYRAPVEGLPDRFAVVQMSATVGPRGAGRRSLTLDDADRSHPVLRRRLEAHKSTRLEVVKVTGDDEATKQQVLAARAVKEARELQARGANVVGIVVNRVDTARMAYQLLAGEQPTDQILVTGRMRALERDALARNELIPRARAGRDRTTDTPVIIVATQCIEAGADLDFDAIVSECASLDALRQRFGRVDRLGERGASQSVVLARSDQISDKAEDPIYGRALAETWTWLNGQALNKVVDFGISSLPSAVRDGEPIAGLLAQTGHAPVLLPSHLDTLAQTSPPRVAPDQDVALWLHGPDHSSADVQIIWRAGIEVDRADADVGATIERLEAVRPSALEGLTLPIHAARRWLAGETEASTTDVVGIDVEEAPRRAKQAEGVVALRWAGDDSELVSASDLRPGDVLVVNVSRGGLLPWAKARGCFDAAEATPVLDLGDLASMRGRGVVSMRLFAETAAEVAARKRAEVIARAGVATDTEPDAEVADVTVARHAGSVRFAALEAWCLPSSMVVAAPAADPEATVGELRDRVRAWLEQMPAEAPDGFLGRADEWRAARAALLSSRLRLTVVGDLLVLKAPMPNHAATAEIEEAVTEGEDSSFRSVEVTLRAHSEDVRNFARRFGETLGLGAALASDLALAAWLHDVGKADRRFQRWLVGGSEVRAAVLPEPLAKSALAPGRMHDRRLARQRAGYPDGYRHELLSLAMVTHTAAVESAHDPELVRHLVASHHGWCRPFAPAVDHAEDLPVAVEHDGVALEASTRHRLARLDSGVADRYWRLVRKYGWWGLAWLEAILRLADHRASEAATMEDSP